MLCCVSVRAENVQHPYITLFAIYLHIEPLICMSGGGEGHFLNGARKIGNDQRERKSL